MKMGRLIDADALWMDVIHSMDYCEDILEIIERQPTCDQIATDTISRRAAIDALKSYSFPNAPMVESGIKIAINLIETLPSAQPELNNHAVACLLADLYDDACACNYNGNDEWLPEKCEVIDSCPNPDGVACWEQFLKHREKKNEGDDL